MSGDLTLVVRTENNICLVEIGRNMLPDQMLVRSLYWEYLLEKEMATQSNILAWEIPWTEEPGGLQSKGSQKSGIQLSNSTTTIGYRVTESVQRSK